MNTENPQSQSAGTDPNRTDAVDKASGWTADKVEDVVKLVILVAIMAAALAQSFTHMKDWTMDWSPKGTHDWFGWANAVISELLPIAATLSLRRRLRQGKSLMSYPLAVLLGGAALSLGAQLAAVGSDASLSAKFLACLPALAFLLLSKMVLGDLDAGAKQKLGEIQEAERRRAERAAWEQRVTALNDQVNKLTAEKVDAARREQEAVQRAADVEADAEREIASIKTHNEAVVAELTAERDALKAETLTLRTDLNNVTEAHNATLTDTVNALKAKHTESMARLRAELSTTNLNDFRSTKSGSTRRQPSSDAAPTASRGVISDEDAVQKLLAHNDKPEHDWSQAEVRRVTGVGFPRAKELINALAEHHRNAAALRSTTRETASPVEAAVTLTDDDKEDHRVA
ncbi:hypothetical protein AB0J14_04920 [Micromonospora arborensis]|uniref:hypothetical protein n=1 Tax=Micromonospora arborensis TaxID=2116518 RepID=UPI0033F87E39